MPAGGDDFHAGRAEPHDVAGCKERRAADAFAVHPRSVQRTKVLNLEPVGSRTENSVRPGDLGIVEGQAGVFTAADGRTARDPIRRPPSAPSRTASSAASCDAPRITRDFADAVVPEPPPAVQPWVIAAALVGDGEEVGMCGLAELPVRPDDHDVTAVEVAEA